MAKKKDLTVQNTFFIFFLQVFYLMFIFNSNCMLIYTIIFLPVEESLRCRLAKSSNASTLGSLELRAFPKNQQFVSRIYCNQLYLTYTESFS